MLRRALTIIVFLFLGVILNVMVAWRCAMWSPVRASAYYNAESPPPRLRDTTGFIEQLHSGGPGFNETFSFWSASEAQRHSHIERWKLTAGLPLHSLYSVRERVNRPRVNYLGLSSRASTQISEGLTPFPSGSRWRLRFNIPEDRHVLPLMPLWPGFAVNTVLGAALLWLVICGPYALRRFVRVQRGRCAACAYPVGTSPVCTECGAKVVPRQFPGAPR